MKKSIVHKLISLNLIFLFAIACGLKGVTRDELNDLRQQVEQGQQLNKADLDKAIAVANEGMQDQDLEIRYLASDLLGRLVANGQAFDAAIKAAVAGPSLSLFGRLVENGQAFDEAIVAASKGIVSDSCNDREGAFALWKSLFEKKQGFAEAIKAAENALRSKETLVRWEAFDLYHLLVEDGHGYDEAINASLNGVKNETDSVVAANLLSFLLQKDSKGIGIAQLEAAKDIESSKANDRTGGLVTWRVLVENGNAFRQAQDAAQKGIADTGANVRAEAFVLWKALVEKKQGFAGAIKAAENGVNDKDARVCSLALNVWQALVENNKGILGATKAASKCITHQDRWVWENAWTLWCQLIQKGYSFDQAVKSAEDCLERKDCNGALMVLGCLANKDQAIDKTIAVASESIKGDVNHHCAQSALMVWSVLIQKGKGIEQAQKLLDDQTIPQDVRDYLKDMLENASKSA